MTKKDLLYRWVDGTYALGWRGWLAMKILGPVIREVLIKENGL